MDQNINTTPENNSNQVNTTETIQTTPASVSTELPKANKSGIFSKKWLLPLIAIVILTLGAGAYMFFAPKALTPEQRYQTALENHLKVTTIDQDYSTKSEAFDVKMDTQADFTDPSKSKAKGSFDYNVTSSYLSMRVEGEAVSTSPDKTYGKYNTFLTTVEGTETDVSAGFKGQWIEIDTSDSAMDGEVATSITGVNTPLGEIIVGNFEPGLRKEIMDKINTDKVYTIKSSEEVEEDGKQLVRFDVQLNKEKLKELNDFVAEKLGIENNTENAGIDGFSIWVDKDTNNFVKVNASHEQEGTKIDINIILGGYGNAVTFDIPEDTMSYDEYKDIFLKNMMNVSAGSQPDSI